MGARLQQTVWVLSVSLLPILYSYKYIYGCAFTTNGMGVISFSVTYTVQLYIYIWVRVYNTRYGCYLSLFYLYCTVINIYIYGCVFATNVMGVFSISVTYTVQF